MNSNSDIPFVHTSPFRFHVLCASPSFVVFYRSQITCPLQKPKKKQASSWAKSFVQELRQVCANKPNLSKLPKLPFDHGPYLAPELTHREREKSVI